MASLFVIKGRDQGRRYELVEPATSIGRDVTNQVQLHDTEVSRRHAEVRFDDVGLGTLSDLGSSNGTFVNGHKVQSHELASGDRVQMGSSIMLYTGTSLRDEPNAAEHIDIVQPESNSDQSHIIRSMTQAEGSEVFSQDDDPGRNPWLARARSNLQVMYRTALAVSHTLDIDQLLDRILELIFEWVEADRGGIMLVDADTKQLVPKARRIRKGINAEDKIIISQSILDYVREQNEGVVTSNAREDQRWDTGASIVQMGIREAMCVPMQGRYDVVGVIYVDTTTPANRVIQGASNKFTEDHLKLMIAIAHQAALAIEDTSYYSAMVQAERLAAIGQTIAMLSHHIKNILQGIRGGSYMIEMGLQDQLKLVESLDSADGAQFERSSDTIRKGWNIVEKNQEKISNLVLDMLTFSKEREPELVPANLNDTAAEVVELMQVRAQERQVQLVWKPDAELPMLTFDPEGLHRAILNVVTNAIDACEGCEGPRVVVSTQSDAPGGLARVIVADNGCGIESEDLKRVFTLFESRKGSRGTGLGLPVSQKILSEHGGQILVESTPGKGSRFTLELPAVLPPEPQDSETTSE